MAVSIHLKLPQQALPPLDAGQMRYVVARDGVYLERSSSMYSSSVRIDGAIPLLEPHEQCCILSCSRIPTAMIRSMLGFFQHAYRLHGGEAVLVLLYHPQRRRYRWHCPVQTVEMVCSFGRLYASDSIQFENPLQLPGGYLMFGDAHSHHGAAVPSWVDRDEEAHQDGLHIIVGHIGSRPTFHIDFSIDAMRFTVPPEDVFTSEPEPPYPSPAKLWIQRVRTIQRSFGYTSSYGSSYGYDISPTGGPYVPEYYEAKPEAQALTTLEPDRRPDGEPDQASSPAGLLKEEHRCDRIEEAIVDDGDRQEIHLDQEQTNDESNDDQNSAERR